MGKLLLLIYSPKNIRNRRRRDHYALKCSFFVEVDDLWTSGRRHHLDRVLRMPATDGGAPDDPTVAASKRIAWGGTERVLRPFPCNNPHGHLIHRLDEVDSLIASINFLEKISKNWSAM